MKATFSIGSFDSDGDMYDERILLWIDNHVILPVKSVEELEEFAKHILEKVVPEIKGCLGE